ncbi:hypothetical protein VPH35_111442 [Triticum aestivum]
MDDPCPGPSGCGKRTLLLAFSLKALLTILGSSQILKAKEESLSRKDIMDMINKWFVACDEEALLEEYNQDSKRYSSGRDAHVNLKRAEKAWILVTKIPSRF